MAELSWLVKFLATADPFMLELGLLVLLVLVGAVLVVVFENMISTPRWRNGEPKYLSRPKYYKGGRK